MINRLNRIVPTALGVAALTLFVGCGDTGGSANSGTSAASASKESTPAQADAEQSASESASQLATARDADDSASNRRNPNRTAGDDPANSLEASINDARNAVANRADRASRRDPGQARSTQDMSGPVLVKVQPEVLDLGEMATRETKSGVVQLLNTGEKPMKIVDSRTSCGCTVANVPKGQELQPGESVDVEVSLRAGARTETISKTVTFIIDGQPPLTLRVTGRARAYVTMEPEILDPEKMPDGRLVLRSEDDTPFVIESMHPQIVEELPEEPATEHELTVDWGQWEEMGSSPRLLIYLDHPKEKQKMAAIRVQRAAQPASRTSADPTRAEALDGRISDRSPGATSAQRDLAILVERGDIDSVRTRLEEGEAVDQADRSGMSLLGVAAKDGNVEMMQMLLEHGADVNATDRIGRTPLMAAAQSKNADAVQLLIDEGANVDARDNTIGNSALAWGAGFGDAESVRALLDAGARVDVVSQATGFTPLIWAAGFGENATLKMLIDAGADIEAADYAEGATPLMHATRTGRTDNVTVLLDAGANLEAIDATGRTPLLWAAGASGADVSTVQALIDAGAKLDATDKRDWNALDHAKARTDARAAHVIALLEGRISPSATAEKAEESPSETSGEEAEAGN